MPSRTTMPFSRFQLETRLNRQSRAAPFFKCAIKQAQFHNLSAVCQVVSIVVKNDRRDIQLVVVSSVSHSESQILQTNVRNDTQPRYAIPGFEILRWQREREIINLVPRQERLFHFLFFRPLRIVQLFRSIVAIAGASLLHPATTEKLARTLRCTNSRGRYTLPKV